MRIISGRLGGRRLRPFKADHIRPTSDRIKGSIFNKLAAHWAGAQVLDLFSGTGNLGIEAHSRGAQRVVCVESHPASLKILRENLRELEISKGVEVLAQDVFTYLKTAPSSFDIVLADPPFTEKMAHEVMTALGQSKVFAEMTVVVMESGSKEPVEELYGELELFDQRDYGDKKLSYFRARGKRV